MRLLLISILIIFCLGPTHAQIKFEIIYGGSGYDHARSVWQTNDNGYIVSGFSNVDGTTNTEVFLLKTDSVGAIEWFKFHGGDEIQAGKSVQQTMDNGFIVAGYTNENIGNAYDFLLIKFDQNGELLWKKTYGGEDWDLGEYVEQTFDGGYIIGGSTFSLGNGGEDGYLIKTDANGNVEWSKTYGGSLDDQFQTVRQCSDSGFVAIGRSTSFSNGDDDVFVVRTNKQGDTLWTKTQGDVNSDYGKSILQNPDGSFVFVGVQNEPSTGLNKAYLVKLNSLGDTEWSHIFGTVSGDEPSTVKAVPWGGYVYSAYNFGGTGAGGKDLFVLKTGDGGNFEYAKTFGGTNDDLAFSMQITNDNGFIIAGETKSYGSGLTNVYLIKTDSLGVSSGTVVIGVDEEPNEIEAKIYPNPVNTELNLVLPQDIGNNPFNFKLFDINGRLVMSRSFSGVNTFKINLEHLNEGIYFTQLIGESFVSSDKVIIVHN